MPLNRSEAPKEKPVTLDEAKAHLRIGPEDTDHNSSISDYLAAVVSRLDGPEGILNRALMTQTLTYTMDGFPASLYHRPGFGAFPTLSRRSGFDLPLPPLQSVSSITYIDDAGDTQTLATSKYRVLNTSNPTRKGRIELAYGETWPTTRLIEQAVTVTYVAGFGDATQVPEHYKHLILIMLKELFDGRDPFLPTSVERSPAFRGLLEQCTFPAVA